MSANQRKRRGDLFRKAVESLNLENPNTELSLQLRYDKGNMSRILSGKIQPSERLVKSFEKNYNLNIEDFEDGVNILHEPKSNEGKSDQEINLYDVEVTAGLVSLFKDPQSHKVIGTIKIPNMPKVDGAITATGDSMYPIIKSGDIMIYKIIMDIPQSIFFGNTYIVSIDVEGDEYTVVKYVKRGRDDDHVLLVSHNAHHADKEVHIKFINAMALVKASIRFNTLT